MPTLYTLTVHFEQCAIHYDTQRLSPLDAVSWTDLQQYTDYVPQKCSEQKALKKAHNVQL